MLQFGICDNQVRIDRIVEQQGPYLPIGQLFPDLTPEVLEENIHWLAPDHVDPQGFAILCIQSYVIRTPHINVLVDSCVGNHKSRPLRPAWNMLRSRQYMAQLRRIGLTVEDIDYVLCTHLHPDHVGWNTRLKNGRWVPTFPNAKYVFGRAEYAFWLGRHEINILPHFEDSVLPVVHRNQAELVASDHHIGDFIKLASAPGHTPDHLVVEIGQKHPEAVLLADAVHSVLQIKYPNLSMCFDIDGDQSRQTRRILFDRFADSETICCPAHFPKPTIGRIKRNKFSFDWLSCSEC